MNGATIRQHPDRHVQPYTRSAPDPAFALWNRLLFSLKIPTPGEAILAFERESTCIYNLSHCVFLGAASEARLE